MASNAEELLRSYGNPSLAQMARQRGIDVRGLAKEEMVQRLAPTFFDPKRIRAGLAALAPAEQLLLDRLILGGGDLPSELLRRQLEEEGFVDGRPVGWRVTYDDVHGSPWVRGSRKFDDLVARLGLLGLAFTAYPMNGNIAELNVVGRRLFIPPEVLGLLPPASIAVEAVDDPAQVQAADPSPMLRDSYLLLSFAAGAPIPLTAKGTIAKRTLVQIDGSLMVREDAAAARSEEDLDRIPFLRAVLQDVGALEHGAGRLEFTDLGEKLLQGLPGERLKLLYDAYSRTQRWCELPRIDTLAIPRGFAGFAQPQAVSARGRVLAEIANLPAGCWIPIAHLLKCIKLRAYEFLLPRRVTNRFQSYGYQANPYVDDNPLGLTIRSIRDEQEGWDVLEAGFIRAILTMPLPWLGVIDIGLAEGKPSAFRVTEAGARLLKGEVPELPPQVPRVVVQPNFQILAFPPTDEAVLFRLDRFSERIRAEQVVEYRLTRSSVYQAQRNGLRASEIAAFLESVGTAPLPQNVQRTLEEWDAQHDRIVLRPDCAVLQAADEATLDSLYADPSLAGLLGRRVAPGVALIRASDLSALCCALMDSQRLPALDEGIDGQVTALLTIDPGGQLRFRHRVPSIHLLRVVEPFSQEDPEGGLRLTPESLRSAARRGLRPDEILTALERWHAGPISAEVSAMIHRSARDWGRGSLAEVAILQVERPEQMRDLLADADLGPRLQPISGAETLAIVRREEVSKLRAALEERGMDLEGRIR